VRTRRRRRRSRGILPGLVILAGVTGASWWLYSREDQPVASEPIALAAQPPILTTDQSETPAPPIPRPDISEKGEYAPAPTPRIQPPTPPPGESPPPSTPPAPDAQPAIGAPSTPSAPTPAPVAGPRRAEALIEAGRQALARDDLPAARSHFNEAFAMGLDEAAAALVRAELTRIGNETIFSGRILAGDPLVDRYVIKAGDSLAKIAAQNAVTADALALINGIADKHRIREGQTIKVVKGPFRAVVHKKSYVLDVYLGDTFVKSFQVGLGVDGSTPTGEWRIKNKLENPTYYPPRGGTIVAADDPQNPLGERWVGLEGVSGEATSQERYGIHGTSEPESIGKSVSLGCIRMHNADVEWLYTYLVEERSTVTVMN
jgi:lipoprotein-anchoring transpeptidase ErfK/SrfK